MAFEKMGSFTFNHADQADELNLAADTAKQKFDSRASELKTAINKVVDLLNATTDGASGADNVGAMAISGVTGTSVQAQMESMKGLVDGKAASGHNHDGSYAPTNLAGEGRTTETVKGNADAIAAHLADTVQHISYAITSGTDTYIVSIPGIDALTEGLSIKIKVINANTGAATLNINSLGAKDIQKSNGASLSSGNIKAGQIIHLVYSGSVFQLLGEGGEYGTAGAAQVLAPYTIGTEGGLVTGAIPSRGTATITPGTTNQIITAGQYLSGVQTIKGDANLVAGNIKSGVNIFGVTGTMESLGGQLQPSTTVLLASNVNKDMDSSGGYVKSKEIRIKYGGNITVYFKACDLQPLADYRYAQIWKNGTPIGIERSLAYNTLSEFSENIVVAPGDYVQIYVNASYGRIRVSDFQIQAEIISYGQVTLN